MRSKLFSTINILGLSTGIAAFLFIMLYVSYELSFDKHFKDSDLIYRVTLDMIWDQAPTQYAAVAPAATAYHVAQDYSEILAGTRLTLIGRHLLEYSSNNASLDKKRFYEENIMMVDSSFFKVFDLEIIAGKKETMLTLPKSVIVSQSMVKKYFGNEEPMGKVLKMDHEEKYVVRGVMKDIPENTHFQADFILSTIGNPLFDVNNWLDLSLYSYVKASRPIDIESFTKKLISFKEKYYAPWKDMSNFRLQKMEDIHLKNDREFDFAESRDINNLYFMIAIAILIILIACINFMNLSTARSMYKSKEVKVRKLVGANREHLIVQFLGESSVIVLISMIISVIMVEVLMPEFRELTETNIVFDFLEYAPILVGFTLFLGIVAGIYPAFFISSFKPASSRNPGVADLGSNTLLRKVLVIFQFVVMVVLLSGSAIIFQQMQFVQNKPLGFDKDLIVHAAIDNSASGKKSQLIKEKLESYPDIENVCLSNRLPSENPWGDHFKVEGSKEFFPCRTSNIGYNYIPTFGMKILAGRNFSEAFGSDSTGSIINESAMKKFGWTLESAIGKKINWNFAENWDNEIHGHVIGVVEDYHFKSLHEKVEPVVLTMNQNSNNIIATKIKASNVQQTISFIENTFTELNPGFPFEYSFLDQDVDRLYKSEVLFEKVFKYFVSLSIFIACLGLFGLAAFLAEKRHKEIGIRKTLGASVTQIVFLFTKNFSFWVLIANIIGWPIAWYSMESWLSNFAYRIDISLLVFVLVGIITQLIATFTVGILAYGAAKTNPVEVMRYE